MADAAWKKYHYFLALREEIKRPYLSFKVRRPDGESVPWTAIVDSGARDTVLDSELASLLGIPCLDTNFKLVYVGGKKYRGYPGKIRICPDSFQDYIDLDVLFIKGFGFSGVLGQEDFFTKFDVCFEYARGIFSIRRVPQLRFTSDI